MGLLRSPIRQQQTTITTATTRKRTLPIMIRMKIPTLNLLVLVIVVLAPVSTTAGLEGELAEDGITVVSSGVVDAGVGSTAGVVTGQILAGSAT